MGNTRFAAGVTLSFACLFHVSAVSAQDSATAGALFERGVADMAAGRFETGCPAVAESERIDPRPGTLFTLAECLAGWGKVASAAARYQEYLDLVPRLTPEQQQRHRSRTELARTQLAKLKSSVPMLTLLLPADAPAGTVVTRNGEVLQGAALGVPLPVDPGEYVIVTRAPGAQDRELKVAMLLGEVKSVTLLAPAMGRAPSAPLAATPSLPPPVASPGFEATGASGAPPKAHGGGKTAAYVAGGIGVAGIALGSVVGVMAMGKGHIVSTECQKGACSSDGLDAARSGKTLATISDVGFGVGLAGLALGAVLWLSGDSPSADANHEQATGFQPLLAASNRGLTTGLIRHW